MNIVSKSLKSLEYDKILERIANFAKFEQSKMLCLNAKPFNDIAQIRDEITFTKEAKCILDMPDDLPIEFVADIRKIQKGLLTGYLIEKELIDVAKTIRTSRLVKRFLTDNLIETSKLRKLAEPLIVNRDLEDMIIPVFDENLKIRPDATQELKVLHTSLKDNEKNLKTKVNELLSSPDFAKHLQDTIYTTRDDRIVFQVMASSKSKVPGIVHDVSATNKTFFIEPQQIVNMNNRIREIKSNIHAEMVKILVNLTNHVKANMKEILASEEILALIDYHFAKGRYAVKTRAIEPEIVMSKFVEFENMQHPLLIETVDDVVSNDFEIGKSYKSIIITGSNTGGKTVTLKTVGLFILMAKTGMFLPCTMAKVYPFEKVLCDIGDDQSILQSLSTFSSHMTNIIEILRQSNNNSFVLMDEICAGTDPHEGAVLAQVILEQLASKGVFSTVTTHYGELKALEYSNDYFKNASVEFNTQTLRPTYKLMIGIPGLSNAISISQNLGLDINLVEKARTIVFSQKDPSMIVVEKLQETQQKLSQNLEEAETIKENSQSIKKEYEENLAVVRKEKKKAIKIIKDKFDYELLDVKAEIKSVLDEIRQEKTEKIARRSYARLAQLEQSFRTKVAKYEEKQEYAEIDWQTVQVGDSLILKELNQPVIVLSLPDKNNNVNVQMGNFTTKIKMEKLAPYDKAYDTKSKAYAPSSFEGFQLKKTSVSNTLDLRGYKVEEALDSLEFYLDKASLANISPVNIIHGHGTGALKSAIRDFISTSPYVANFRPGEDGEGGDGVSIIDIK